MVSSRLSRISRNRASASADQSCSLPSELISPRLGSRRLASLALACGKVQYFLLEFHQSSWHGVSLRSSNRNRLSNAYHREAKRRKPAANQGHERGSRRSRSLSRSMPSLQRILLREPDRVDREVHVQLRPIEMVRCGLSTFKIAPTEASLNQGILQREETARHRPPTTRIRALRCS